MQNFVSLINSLECNDIGTKFIATSVFKIFWFGLKIVFGMALKGIYCIVSFFQIFLKYFNHFVHYHNQSSTILHEKSSNKSEFSKSKFLKIV